MAMGATKPCIVEMASTQGIKIKTSPHNPYPSLEATITDSETVINIINRHSILYGDILSLL